MPINPPVKTKVTIDPDTGARIFNQSWSSELKKKEPIKRKPVSRDTFVTEKKVVVKPAVAKETTVKTSGGRRFSEVISPSPAKAVGMELKGNTDISKKAPKDWREVRREGLKVKAEMEDKKLLQDNPGKDLYQIKRDIQKQKERNIRKINRSVKDEGPAAPNKRGSGGCTRC